MSQQCIGKLLQCSMFVIFVCSGSAQVATTTPSMQAEDSHTAASSIKFMLFIKKTVRWYIHMDKFSFQLISRFRMYK